MRAVHQHAARRADKMAAQRRPDIRRRAELLRQVIIREQLPVFMPRKRRQRRHDEQIDGGNFRAEPPIFDGAIADGDADDNQRGRAAQVGARKAQPNPIAGMTPRRAANMAQQQPQAEQQKQHLRVDIPERRPQRADNRTAERKRARQPAAHADRRVEAAHQIQQRACAACGESGEQILQRGVMVAARHVPSGAIRRPDKRQRGHRRSERVMIIEMPVFFAQMPAVDVAGKPVAVSVQFDCAMPQHRLRRRQIA